MKLLSRGFTVKNINRARITSGHWKMELTLDLFYDSIRDIETDCLVQVVVSL